MVKLDLEALRRRGMTPHYFASLVHPNTELFPDRCEHREHGPGSQACGLPADDPIHLPPRSNPDEGGHPEAVG